MTKVELERITRGDVISCLGKTWDDISSDDANDLISGVMSRVKGAELVRELPIPPVDDEYDIVYHISPEGVTCHIKVGIGVSRTLYGEGRDNLESATKRVREAFGTR